MLRRLLAARGSGSFPGPPLNYVGLINAAATSSYNYVIGPISSSDGGFTWTAGSGSNIGPGPAYASVYVKDPCLVWDGSQFVCYYCGWNGSNFQVARATASAYDGSWTNYGSNPILGVPIDGSYRNSGALFPFVPNGGPIQRMWVTGSNAGVYTIGYLTSADNGLTWTDHGKVLDLGTTGQFDASGLVMGSALLVGSTWYIYYGGLNASNFYHGGYATVPVGSEATAGSYTKGGVLSGFSSTVAWGGFTWRSNMPRGVYQRGGQFIALWVGWNASGFFEEGAGVSVGTDPVTFPVPSGLMVPFASWHANSGENPIAIPAP